MVINGKSLLNQQPIVNMENAKQQDHGVSFGLSEVGYDIRLKQTVIFVPDVFIPQVEIHDPTCGIIQYQDGNFTLASAMEEFAMPEDMMGIVHDKSTWARHGLSVFNTVIEPGWKGFLTLELVYHGRRPLTIPAGSGIAQVVFHTVAEPARYDGKYQNQADKPVEPILVNQ